MSGRHHRYQLRSNDIFSLTFFICKLQRFRYKCDLSPSHARSLLFAVKANFDKFDHLAWSAWPMWPC
jgi:hypothetical protein